jgi:hypothetical protein
MEVTKFKKELAKAVRKFERRCKQEGDICDPVRVGLVEDGFNLETTVKTAESDYITASTDVEVEDGKIVLLYFEFGGMVYDF